MADDGVASTPAASAPDRPARPVRRFRWGGLVLPLVTYNTIDGLGVGAGAEVFDRERSRTHGYRNKVGAWIFWAVNGSTTTNYLQFEHRTRHHVYARLQYRGWYDMIYVGSGGRDVSVALDPAVSRGNTVQGPGAVVGAELQLPRSPVYVFTQAYARYAVSEAQPGGILDQRRPFGLGKAFYWDTSAGVAVQETDRWPVPNKGVRFETSFRAGGTHADDGFHPLVGVNVEAMGWWPVATEWFVVGGRVLFDHTWGDRPWWEQENLGGEFRDEVGYEQMLTGYQRSRSRGDGVLAAELELRPRLGYTWHPFFQVSAYLSLYGEVGWIFQGNDPGPLLPTLGLSPTLLWQGAVQLRGFGAWGWLSDVAGGRRTPQVTFGVSITGPL